MSAARAARSRARMWNEFPQQLKFSAVRAVHWMPHAFEFSALSPKSESVSALCLFTLLADRCFWSLLPLPSVLGLTGGSDLEPLLGLGEELSPVLGAPERDE
eukprot:CAMPEP_0185555628 /NCGR_PEP_ID=MMETSP1381-20130426/45023_1 /TAXON_ID=298111 /ORGANISM="Pavlova sp., Strain CCMP459" /LENGTH=101 /DNA_ID=CAMNT_0028168947 /DNA_START=1 /DNA_END=302 /DNA_ORIENTATION=+